jgi:TIR domain-containing protein
LAAGRELGLLAWVKYWAFISYSHKDTAIADWLHKKLETYRVPPSLVGTPTRDGTAPERLIPIFRDREELPTSSQLGDNLQRSLQQARYLVVICSPASAQSRWVEEEIRSFKNWHGRDRIIALIGSGIPNAIDPAEECFPHSLRFETDGADASPVRIEPIAADLRPEGDGRERAFLKIVAGLLGVGFDDLYQREKRREQRRRMLLTAAIAAGILILAAIYWSFRSELGSVRKEAGLLTTEYKNVRPKNKDAEKRIVAAAQEVDAALTTLEQARQNTTTAAEYKSAMANVQKVLNKPVQVASTTDESIFAMEVSKPLNERLAKIQPDYTEELKRRLIDEATKAYEKKRDAEKAAKK